MSQLPVTVDFGTLPNNGQGYTPQEFANRLGLNGRIFTEQDFALFTIGATAPTSNSGPWAKNGNSWYYWDSVSGSYVPFVIPSASLGYSVSAIAPNPALFQFWIQLNGAGSPLALKTYFSGTWVDVYAATMAGFSTTVAMNAAIATQAAITIAAANAYTTAAIAAIPGVTIVAGQGVFSGVSAAAQSVVFGGAGSQTGSVDLGAESFDPDNCFGSNVFTAPAAGYYTFQGEVRTDVASGAPTAVEIGIFFVVNGTPSDRFNNEETDGPGGQTVVGSTTYQLGAGNTVGLGFDFTVNAACTIEMNPTRLSGFRIR